MDWLGKIEERIKKESRPRRLRARGRLARRRLVKAWLRLWNWFAETWRERGIAGFYEAFNSWLAKRRERVIARVRSSPDLLVLVILIVLIWIVWEVWNWILLDLPTVSGDTPQGTGGGDQQGKQIVFRSEVVRNMGLLIAAVIGLVFGIWRAYTAYRQTQASEIQAQTAASQANTAARGHFAERFAAAAEHLGHESLAVRLGGLYALAALGRDAEASDVVSIADVICSFVRTDLPKKDEKQGGAEETQPPERSDEDTGGKEQGGAEDTQPPKRSDEDTGGKEEPSITEDIQVALDILTHRQTGLRNRLPERHHLNLKGADLRGADLFRANLGKANLHRANLNGAYLRGTNLLKADLTGANLREANLRRANLNGIDLCKANLDGAHLLGAYLLGANLYGANLSEADLTKAELFGADLRKANLGGAHLVGSKLTKALLWFAKLTGADLTRADLDGAALKGANLSRAKLREAKNLIQEQVDDAALSDFDKPPSLPEGLTPPTNKYERPPSMSDRFA